MEWMYFWSKFAVLLSDYLSLQRKGFLYKITFQGFPVEIGERMEDKSLFEERRSMRCFSSGNLGRLKYASMLP